MTALVTFIAYQAVWFAAVAGAGRGLAWPGLGAAVARGWHAVILPAKPQMTLLALALGWAAALPVLTSLARRWLVAGATDGLA